MSWVLNIDSVSDFLLATFACFLVVAGRYFLIAGSFHLFFYVWRKKQWAAKAVVAGKRRDGQFKMEMAWSLVNAFIFAITGVLLLMAWQKGITRIYLDPLAYGWWWLPLSLCISMGVHETYYYFLHRWMHRPKVFSIVHKVHHDSHITSPWTAFSFHPIEGVLQAIFLPALLLVLPMHPAVLLIQLTLMTFSSVINHLSIEVYPKDFHRHWLGKWLIGATHHALHHKQFKYNFGLYFTWWDKFKKTESPQFEKLFEEKSA